MINIYRKVSTLVVFFLALWIGVRHANAALKVQNDKLGAPSYIHVYRHSETSVKITWKRVKFADGYTVFRYNSKTKKYNKVKTVKGSKKTQVYDKKLKTNKTYRYQVKSYVIKNRKKKYGDASYYAEAKTYRKKDRVVNAGKISSDKKVTLGITMSKKMDTYVKPSKYGKNKRALSQKLRWKSSNEEIATVTAKGKIVAGIKEGKCIVYAIAHNGNRRKIKVTVKNYAYPENFDGYSGIEPIINDLLNNYKTEICNIASYFTIHKPSKDLTMRLDDHGNIVGEPSSTEFSAIKSDVNRLLKNFPVYIEINITDRNVEFYMRRVDDKGDMLYWCHVEYYYYDDYKQFNRIIAKHWRYFRFLRI